MIGISSKHHSKVFAKDFEYQFMLIDIIFGFNLKLEVTSFHLIDYKAKNEIFLLFGSFSITLALGGFDIRIVNDHIIY